MVSTIRAVKLASSEKPKARVRGCQALDLGFGFFEGFDVVELVEQVMLLQELVCGLHVGDVRCYEQHCGAGCGNGDRSFLTVPEVLDGGGDVVDLLVHVINPFQ